MKEYVKNFLIKIFSQQTKKIIKKHNPIIVGIVGSVGKTSTKIAVATVLSEKYRVLYQNGNYNTPISVPFIFLDRDLPKLSSPFAWSKAWFAGQKMVNGSYPYDVVVVELGTDKPGDIIEFKNLLKLDIAVVSAVSEEHMESFENLDSVASEELSVSEYSKIIIVNSDDVDKKYIDKYIPKKVDLHSFGFEKSEYGIAAKRLNNQNFSFSVIRNGSKIVSSDVPLVAKHSLSSYAAAVAVADILGIDKDLISTGIQKIQPAAGRMQLLQAKKNSVIIDDSYNSSPLALQAALDAFYDMKAAKKIAILGMMNELGDYSKSAHEKIGKLCVPEKMDLLITIGKDANSYLATVAESNGCKVIRANSPKEAGEAALKNLTTNAIILVKGSQNGVFSEESIKPLLSNPEDTRFLVRQSDFWMSQKSNQFNINASI